MSASPSLRFLVVEDDDDVRTALVGFVERAGHEAHQAADGAEAVEALALETYDFMLLDLSMPRMSGEDVLRWLREHPEHAQDLRVVVVSARILESIDQPDVHAMLLKPVRAQQLRKLIADTQEA